MGLTWSELWPCSRAATVASGEPHDLARGPPPTTDYVRYDIDLRSSVE
jgi:hypothetical protein